MKTRNHLWRCESGGSIIEAAKSTGEVTGVALVDVFRAMNGLVADAIIERWIPVGSVGASLCIHPFHGPCVDILVEGSASVSDEDSNLPEIHARLQGHGHTVFENTVSIVGWPVRLRVARTALEVEAINTAPRFDIGVDNVWVATPEHVIALAVERHPHDLVFIGHFLDVGMLDMDHLAVILARHGLTAIWEAVTTGASSSVPSSSRLGVLVAKHHHRQALAAAPPEQKLEIMERMRVRADEVNAVGRLRG